MLKTYSNKTNAKRAAKAAGLDISKFEFLANSVGSFFWLPLDCEVTTATKTPILAAVKVTAEAAVETAEAEVEAAEAVTLAKMTTGYDDLMRPITVQGELVDTAVPATTAGAFVPNPESDHYEAEFACGFDCCPNCGTNFDNGIDYADVMIDEREPNKRRRAYGHAMQHDFLCMACDTEFGPTRRTTKAKVQRAPTGTGIKIQKNRPEQNGVKMPSEGGKTYQVWEWCSNFVTEYGGAPTNKEVREWGVDANSMNKNMVCSQYAYWRKFNGIVGRIVSVLPAAEA